MPADENQHFERLRGQMATILRVEAKQITRDTQFGDFPQWDSMGHMDLMVMLESEFGLPITAETISELVSVDAILEAINSGDHG